MNIRINRSRESQNSLNSSSKIKRKKSTTFVKSFFGMIMMLVTMIILPMEVMAEARIAATNGGSVCAKCSPPGWAVDNGTPDISDRNQAAASGTSGGGTPWNAAPLPLPPNGHTTWLSIRDLGPNLNEEIVSTDMTGLIVGYTYEISLYTLTATGQYSTNYNDAFRYIVGSHPIQTLSPLSHDEWETTTFRFIADKTTERLQLLPGNNSPSGFQSVQVSVALNAIQLVPGAKNDDLTVIQDTIFNGNLFSDNSHGSDTMGDETGGSTVVTNFDNTSAQGATVVVNADGTFSYTPVTGFIGTDTFSYSITDSLSGTSTAIVTITVERDTDGDGVIDSIDLDDDNDGILDTVEGNTDSDMMDLKTL